MRRPSVTQVIEAELTWLDGQFRRDVSVAIDDSGKIAGVGRRLDGPRLPLPGLALIPGFVNVHSHAFQRGLRGRTEAFPNGAGDFWSWRDEMYGLVESLDAASLRDVCRQAFGEMRDAGVTSVGEFHYLHHGADGKYTMAPAVLAAAADVGIRMVLIHTAYVSGGFGRALAPQQARFATADLDDFWAAAERTMAGMGLDQSLGIAAHSVRAVPLAHLKDLRREAHRRGLVFHMHLEEQQQEVDECQAAHGVTPLALVARELAPDASFTAVHGTYAGAEQLAAFLVTGANLCVCPLTEANLGDGLPALTRGAVPAAPATWPTSSLSIPAPTTAAASSGQLCLGTDSNARISMIEEMRWLELGQRLRTRRRGALANESGAVAPVLLGIATEGGARALGLPTGRIEAGRLADFALVDLTNRALRGVRQEDLAAALALSADSEAIVGTAVGGRWRHRVA